MRKRVAIRQRDTTDCGAACLASVAAYYQLRIPVSRIRQHAGTDKQGTNVLGLIDAADKLGFEAKGVKGTMESLAHIPLPAIAHVVLKNGLQHYMVLYAVKKKHLILMDPAGGVLHRLERGAFEKIWTGVLVLLLQADGFQQGNQVISHARRFWQLARPQSGVMLQALAGALFYTLLGLSSSIYLQKIVDHVLVEGNLRLLNLLSVLMLIILVFQVVIGGMKTVLMLKTGQLIDTRLILGYYKHLLRLPQRFFDTMRVGEIISRINDAVKIRSFINDTAINIIVNGCIIIFSIALMFVYYWKLACIVLAIVPVYAAIYFINNRINKRWLRTLMENAAELETQLVESLHAVGTIKRFGLEEYANIKTENRFITLMRTVFTAGVLGLYTSTAAECITRLFTIIVLWSGSYFVIHNELSPGELLSFYALIGYFTAPAAALIGANRNVQDALIAADRLFEIIDLETESSAENKIMLTPALIGDIRFNAVHFRYGTRVTVFDNLTLKIKKSSSTAIIGESGSGKSTLLSLLQNLYPPNEGTITIGELDVRYMNQDSLRKVIAVVPQQIDLFAGTVMENIAIGDFEPDLHRITGISRLLGIDEFIEKLPNNYNTLLHEQGINLSGGQRQRIAIARAIYRNPEILILDEPTASLDPASEEKVHNTLQWFRRQGKTIIIIAHRLSTIKSCDAIIILHNGKVLDEGSHASLIASSSFYKNMWHQYTGNV